MQLEVVRPVNVAIDGAVRSFAKGDSTEGLSTADIGRMRRLGAFGDDETALGGGSEGETVPEQKLEDMTVEQLKALAADPAKPIDLGDAKLKADIVAKIKAAQEGGNA